MGTLKLIVIGFYFVLLPCSKLTYGLKVGTNLDVFIEKYKSFLPDDVDPCDDFLNYTLGGKRMNYLQKVFSARPAIEDIYNHHFKGSRMLRPGEKKLQEFMSVCLSESAPDYYSVLKSYSEWPVLSWNYNPEWNWQDVVAKLKSNQISSLIIDYLSWTDGKRCVNVGPYSKDSYTAAVKSESLSDLRNILKITPRGWRRILSNVETLAQKYSDNVSESAEGETMLYKSLKQETPEFDWDNYFRVAINLTLNDDEVIVVKDLAGLKTLFKITSETERETVAYYLLFNLYQNLASDVSPESCYSTISSSFRDIIGRFVFENYFTDSMEETIFETFHYMTKAIKLLECEYSVETNISEAIDSLKERFENLNIAFLNIDDRYEDITMESNNLQNYLNLQRLQRYVYYNMYKEHSQTSLPWQISDLMHFVYINRNKPKAFIVSSAASYYSLPLTFDDGGFPIPVEMKECFIREMPSELFNDTDVKTFHMPQLIAKLAITTKLMWRTFTLWKNDNWSFYHAENSVLQYHKHSFEKILFENWILMIFSGDFESIEQKNIIFYLTTDTKLIADEYNCPPDSRLYQENVCKI